MITWFQDEEFMDRLELRRPDTWRHDPDTMRMYRSIGGLTAYIEKQETGTYRTWVEDEKGNLLVEKKDFKGHKEAKIFGTKYMKNHSNGEYEVFKKHQSFKLMVSSEHNDWITPTELLDTVREFYGGVIDLDAASSEIANRVVEATHYISDDSLNICWSIPEGAKPNVWINPPYGKIGAFSRQQLFLDKAIKEWEQGHIHQAIVLCKNALGYLWFENTWRILPSVFLRDRPSFIRYNEKEDNFYVYPFMDKRASVLFYIGDNVEGFHKHFGKLGRCIHAEPDFEHKEITN